MPLNRSPLGASSSAHRTNLQHCDSEPNIHTTPENEYYVNTFQRKRKHSNDISDELNMMQEKFLAMFTSFKNEQDNKYSTILEFMGEIKQQNEEIRQSINFMSDKYDSLLDKVHNLEEQNSVYCKRIQELEEKYERESHATKIELRNVPKKTHETKDDLLNILVKTGGVLGSTLHQSDVKNIYRINTKNEGNKPIIADFTSCLTKDKFISNLKKYNKTHPDKKLNSKDISLDGPAKPIYISDNLPQRTRQLYAAAREFAKKKNYIFCWTSAGRVFLKQSEQHKPILIKCQEELNKLSAE